MYAAVLDAMPREARRVITDGVIKFRRYWNESATFSAGQIPDGFDYKALLTVPGQFTLHQFTVGRSHRVAFMKAPHDKDAYLIGCWKKTKQNNRREIGKAENDARHFWTKHFGG